MTERCGVARRGLDTEAEEIADAAEIATGGVDLLENAIRAQRLRIDSGLLPREGQSGSREARSGLCVTRSGARLGLL